MDPITTYRLAKLQHDEIQAEFEHYQRYRLSNPGEPGWLPRCRLILGWGSLVLGALMIAQKIMG